MDKAHKDNDETFANQVVTLLNNAVTTYIKDVEDVVKTPSLPTVKGSAAAPPPSAPQPPPSSSPAARPSITPVNESPPSLLSQIQGIKLKETEMGKKLGITGGGRRTRKGKGRDRRRTRRVNRKWVFLMFFSWHLPDVFRVLVQNWIRNSVCVCAQKENSSGRDLVLNLDRGNSEQSQNRTERLRKE